MTRITLDGETFKALASSTRLTVLRALDERRKTLTELAKDMALNKATVHEHLQLLQSAGLVRKRDDEGRKWIYWELTWTGQRILHPQETTTFSVLLGLSVAAAGGGFFMLGRALEWWLQGKTLTPTGDEAGDSVPLAPAGASSTAPAATPTSTASPPAQQDANGLQMESGATESPPTDPPGDSGSEAGLFDQDGWLSLALFFCSALLVVLAALLRRKLRAAPASPAPGDE
ncbi:MAG TPA: winged helix-turn-helix domain-containing protein [Candidatus Thermoplasmatota archaeon]|nr:winged helix-turn-helix domain-containing protein [Candidatus Thermoplasmatota archaeon]